MHHYLYVNEANRNEYTLKQFFGLVFEDIIAEDYELKVILPEGVTEIKVKNYFKYVSLLLLLIKFSLFCLLMLMINIRHSLIPI